MKNLIEFIRLNSTSSISNFLSKKTQMKSRIINSIRPDNVKFESKSIVSSFDKYNLKYDNYELFIKGNYPSRFTPLYASARHLPQDAVDIKGIASDAYQNDAYRIVHQPKVPTILTNDYLTMKFYPKDHPLSLLRKSNIAFGFVYQGNRNLHLKFLEKDNSIKGKYRNHSYFHDREMPLDSAMTRGILRKTVKRELFNALQLNVEENQISKVSGVYFFSLKKPLVTTEDRVKLQKDLNHTIERLINGKYKIPLKKRNESVNKFIRKVRKEVLMNAQNTLGYYPRLPFHSR